MIITGIIRTKTLGSKKLVQVDGYRDVDDLDACRRIIQQQYPYSRAILFAIPTPDIQEIDMVNGL